MIFLLLLLNFKFIVQGIMEKVCIIYKRTYKYNTYTQYIESEQSVLQKLESPCTRGVSKRNLGIDRSPTIHTYYIVFVILSTTVLCVLYKSRSYSCPFLYCSLWHFHCSNSKSSSLIFEKKRAVLYMSINSTVSCRVFKYVLSWPGI